MSKKKSEKFYNFSFNEQKNETDLYLYGEIVPSADYKWAEEDVCFQDFKDVIDNMGESTTLNIHVNSPGGSVFASSAIVTLLKDTKRRGVTINSFIDSLGASCCSWVPLVADNVYIYKNSILMVHRAMTSCFMSNADELQKQIELLNKIEDNVMLPLYMDKAKEGITEDYIKDLLKAETWMSSDEIMEVFDVTLLEEDHQEYVACVSKDIMKNYTNIPDNIKELLDKQDNSDNINNKKQVKEEKENMAKKKLSDLFNSDIDDVKDNEVDSEVEDKSEEENSEDTEVKDIEDNSEIKDDESNVEDTTDDNSEENNDTDENVEDKSEEGEVEDSIDNDSKYDDLNNKINVLIDENLQLKELVDSMKPIVNAYNDKIKAEKEAERESAQKELSDSFKNRFYKLGAEDKFESDEVQNLLKTALTNSEDMAKLNSMIIDLMDNKLEETTNTSESKLVKYFDMSDDNDLKDIVPSESGAEKFGFR